jgi:hypothetical protein
MWDPCAFQPGWHHKTHYNALMHLWQGDFIFCNPPYSIGAKFVSKCLLEFLRGKNIVMLIPSETSVGAFGRRYLAKVGRIMDIGLIAFENFPKVLHKSVSLVFLLQPNVIQHRKLEIWERNNRLTDEALEREEELSNVLATTECRINIARQLIQRGVLLQVVRHVTRLDYGII